MDGRINIAKTPELMVSRSRPSPVEKANPASVPGPNSPLENTPHKAGIVGHHLVGATITLLDMSAQSGRTAGADVAESFPLLWGDGVPPSFKKSLSKFTEDIGYFESMFSHLLLPSPSVVRISRIGRSSSGLTVVRNLRSETWR